MARSYNIASIPGDGIGPEVVSAAIQVVEKLARTLGTFQLEFTHIPWGTTYYKQTGRYIAEDAIDTLRKFDAVIFGAVGAPGTLYSSTTELMAPVLILC
jgi:isocitrate/isopropylmalate dehydrogenase